MKHIPIPALAILVLGAAAVDADPPWWDGQNPGEAVLDAAAANDHGPANLGQIKWIAHRAHATMEAKLPGGAGFELDDLFPPMPATEPERAAARKANLAPANLGQLKAVAKPFYDRFLALGFDTRQSVALSHLSTQSWWHAYPWDPSTPKSVNDAIATVGQVKLVFGFRFESGPQPGEEGLLEGGFTPVPWTVIAHAVDGYPGARGSTFEKISGGYSWDAAAAGERTAYGGGAVRFRTATTDKAFMIGLSEFDDPGPYDHYKIDFAIYLTGTDAGQGPEAWVYEDGVSRHAAGKVTYDANTVFEVRRTGSTIRYYADGVAFGPESAGAAPLFVDATALHVGAMAVDCLCRGFSWPDADSDGDGMTDGWEAAHGLDPASAADADGDPDGDGFSNLDEFAAGTDPGTADSPVAASTQLVVHTPLE